MSYGTSDFPPYDIWLHWDVTRGCNLMCEYCFNPNDKTIYKYEPVNIAQLMKTVSATGKIFRIGFTGGEPFFIPNFIELCKTLTEAGHYISVNSNITHKKIKTFCTEINPDKVVFVHASFHYDELMKKGIVEKYVEHYRLLQESGFYVYSEMPGYPGAIDKISEIKTYSRKNKLDVKFGLYIGNYKGKNYPYEYSDEELEIFGLSKDDIDVYLTKGVGCNAGYNVGVVNSAGDIKQCFFINESLGNIYSKINMLDDMLICQVSKCGCPLNEYDKGLYNKALGEVNKRKEN